MINKLQSLIGENGRLELPNRTEILELIGQDYIETAEKMWEAAWRAYIKNKGTISTPFWSNKFNNVVAINKVLKFLSQEGWLTVTTEAGRNWSEAQLNESKLLQYTSQKHLDLIRAKHKFDKYLLRNELPTYNDKAKVRGKKKDIGIVRNGFYKAGKTQFKFDVDMMKEHYDPIVAECRKSMEKIRKKYDHMTTDDASYDEVITTVIDYLIKNDGTYCPGQSHGDPRGRDIAGYLDKIFNPVAFKMARSLLVIPHGYRNKATRQGLNSKYLFIAELAGGFKEGTVQDKINYGRKCYLKEFYHNLDWTTKDKIAQVAADTELTELEKEDKIDRIKANAEKSRTELHENIWLERTYKDIDNFLQPTMTAKFKRRNYNHPQGSTTFNEAVEAMEAKPNSEYRWVVPVEIDMSASVLGYLGLLMNHEPFMERCNMLGDNLVDAWMIKGISTRAQAKSIMKTVYGSSQLCQDDWTEQGLDFTPEDVLAYEQALIDGEIALGARFKDFIIENCMPQLKMNLHIWNENVETECNRFSQVGVEAKAYDLYDTRTDSAPTIIHTTTVSVPDLEQFRLYFITALIHNLDSQVINTATEYVMDTFMWTLPIHDALILCCEAADPAREVYAGELEKIHANRLTILENYFYSIGIPASAMSAWKEVLAVVMPFEGKFKCNNMVLK